MARERVMTELDDKLRPYLTPEAARVEPAIGPKVDGAARLTDEEILQRARAAPNGKGQHFAELYDRGGDGAYASASEADLALCSILMFWASNDRATADRLFRQSALGRTKWDERQDYRERTLDAAAHKTGGYRPPSERIAPRPTVVPPAPAQNGSSPAMRCDRCGNPSAMRQYCSNACKQAAYRERLRSNGRASTETAEAAAIGVTWTSEVTPRRVEYIWRGRIARGKLTAIGGDPGVGKGTLGIDLAARISTGRVFPDGETAPLGRILLLSGEDDEADTITPRLIAAGGDRARVGVIGHVEEGGRRRRISLDTDAEMLMQQCSERSADALIIDPLASYLGGGTNSWRDADMRRILDPLAEAAARHAVAVLTVVHLTKDGKSRAMYRFQGSIANIAAARFGFLVAEVKDSPGLLALACVKSNLARKPATLTFRIAPIHLQEIDDEIGRIEWVGATDRSADDLLGADGNASGAVERAVEFLENYEPGQHPSEEIKSAAADAGIGQNTLWEAKKQLGIQAKKRGISGWDWVIP